MSALFYDDEYHPTRAAIEDGKGYQETAQRLWPSMKPESAYARLKACTNSQGDQRLRFGEIIEVMRFNQRFDPLYYACDEALHHRPAPKAPQDEEAKLVSAINGAADTLQRAMNALEALRRREVKVVA
jgi:hypothetical protein